MPKSVLIIGATTGWNWNPAYAPRLNLTKDLPIQNLYAVGHYIFNPGAPDEPVILLHGITSSTSWNRIIL